MGGLKEIVDELSGKRDRERRELIKCHIRKLGLELKEQRFWLGSRSNLFVDLPVDSSYDNSDKKIMLVSSHYDAVKGSPGANDNASAVAVVLGLADRLKDLKLEKPIRLAFFDCEEYWPIAGALNGSLNYIKTTGINDIDHVLNFELVGEGTVPVFWPIIGQSDEYVSAMRKSAVDAGTAPHFVEDIILNVGDHTAFQYSGIHDSVCLTLGCAEDYAVLCEMEKIKACNFQSDMAALKRINAQIFFKTKTFRNYHRPTDSPEFISEESLVKAEDIALGIIKNVLK